MMKWPLFEYGAHSKRVYNSQFHTWGRVKKKESPMQRYGSLYYVNSRLRSVSCCSLRGGAQWQQTSMRNYVTT